MSRSLCFPVLRATVAVLIGWSASQSATAEPKPLVGFPVGPTMDRIAPGECIIDPPTLECLGFRWYVQGDSNRNASVAVSHRKKGDADWKQALPMLRVHHEIANKDYGPYRCGNLFAGSVMFLEPGTEHEVRFVMQDPDGGAAPAKTVTVRTREVPPVYQGLRTLDVYPKGHTGARVAGAIVGLMAAYQQARPGDVLLLHAGIYEGPFALEKPGEPGKPIVFRGGVDGEAIIQGPDHKTNLIDGWDADYLTFEHVTFRRARMALRCGLHGGAGASGLVVRHCKFEDLIFGIWTDSENSENWYIADNVFTGTNPTWHPRPNKTYMEPSHTGINVYGRGHVVCHNRISRFSDSLAIANYGPPVDDVRKHCVAIDFHNNDLTWAQDDCIETDYGCHNVRVYRNRCTNAHTGLSAQPFYGGPCYFIRNEMYGITALPFKLHNYCTGLEIYHNTSCCAEQGFRSFHMWQNATVRNNLFLGGERYAMETGSPTRYTTLDHNGWRKNSEERFFKWFDGKEWHRCVSLKELREKTGHEEHGVQVDYDVFTKASVPEAGRTCQTDDFDLRLRPDGVAVDAGQIVANVNDGFAGEAPDLGCHEVGHATPHYGPRTEG